jgi:hypothetical protein
VITYPPSIELFAFQKDQCGLVNAIKLQHCKDGPL